MDDWVPVITCNKALITQVTITVSNDQKNLTTRCRIAKEQVHGSTCLLLKSGFSNFSSLFFLTCQNQFFWIFKSVFSYFSSRT